MVDKTIEVIGFKSTGAAVAEALLSVARIPYERVDVNYLVEDEKKEFLLSLNPLGQLPTLLMPDGQILTETLAIAVYVDGVRPELGLVASSENLVFWRWVVFIVSSIYPTFTYGDSPEKWVESKVGGAELRQATNEWREYLWLQVESEARGPYFLGERFSVIDIYISVMSHWRPRRPWFKKNCPKLFAIAEKVDSRRELKEIWHHHFGH